MNEREGAPGAGRVKLLPGEEFQLALEPEGGVFYQPPDSPEALLLTDLRVIHFGLREGQRFVAMASLSQVGSIEVRDRQRRPGRLWMGGILTGLGIAVTAVVWSILEVPPLALLVGGIPAVVGIYFLMAFLLSEDEGSLVLLTPGHAVNFPLRSRQSADDAYLLVDRFWELSKGAPHGVAAPAERVTETAISEPQAVPPDPTAIHAELAAAHLEAPVVQMEPSAMPSEALEEVLSLGGVPPHEQPLGVSRERGELLEKLATTRSQLVELVGGLSEERAAHIPGETEWSVKQNLAHVAEVEQRFVADALLARLGAMPDVGIPGEDQWTRSQETANQRALPELLEELAQVRRESLAAIDSIAEEELFHRMRHRRFGELNVLQLLRAIYRHDRMHVEQVAGILAAVGEAAS